MGFTCKTASCFAKNDEFRLAISLRFHECSQKKHTNVRQNQQDLRKETISQHLAKEPKKTNKATRTTPNINKIKSASVARTIHFSALKKALEAKMVPKWLALRE